MFFVLKIAPLYKENYNNLTVATQLTDNQIYKILNFTRIETRQFQTYPEIVNHVENTLCC